MSVRPLLCIVYLNVYDKFFTAISALQLFSSPIAGFSADRHKAALLFWFFGGFRCGVPLLSVFLSYINIKIE